MWIRGCFVVVTWGLVWLVWLVWLIISERFLGGEMYWGCWLGDGNGDG